MIELFSSGFMQKALLAGLLVSIVSGILSVFVVLRKMSFAGTGISHAAFGGVAIGFFTGLDPLASAVFYTIAVAVGIELVRRKGWLSGDVSVGIFYSLSMALGVALTSLSKSYNIDLFGYLFGNILTISNSELLLMAGTFIIVSLFIILYLKEMFLSTYSEELAQVSGIRVQSLNILFSVALALAIVVSMRVVGIIMVSALLIIPGATARLFAKNLISMLILSCLAGALSVCAGLLLSYRYDIASGASIVLTASALFFISISLKKRT